MEKVKTYAEVLQNGYEEEGTFLVNYTIQGISAVINKEIYTNSKVTPSLSEIYNEFFTNA